MPSINFFTENVKFNPSKADKNALRKWIAAVVKREKFTIGEINYIFCSDKFLHQLNEQFLHHDDYTDIITFDLSTSPSAKKIQGEIFISVERIKENAKKFNTTFHDELHRVMIHGVLHLAGHKDKTKSDKSAMRKKENYYLNLRSF